VSDVTDPAAGRLLVVAKAPVPGRVKTRLGAGVGMEVAARLAAAALLDTVSACVAAVGAGRCALALEGNLAEAADAEQITAALGGWTVFPQRGEGLAERLANSHLDLAAAADGPVVQVCMDTPQVSADDLLGVLTAFADGCDAVLGDAEDGGWWALALADPRRGRLLVGVPMSTPTTGAETRRAFERAGLRVGGTRVLRDVDTVEDAEAVAAVCGPDSEFARVWRESR
jgi:glycosyltransferase A (GT-A) superfamily protein (DUF2064 family)